MTYAVWGGGSGTSWILAIAGFFGALFLLATVFFLATAQVIEKIAQDVADRNARGLKEREYQTVGLMAGTLIGGVLANPEYWQRIAELEDQRLAARLIGVHDVLTAAKEHREPNEEAGRLQLEDAQEALSESSVLSWKGRAKYIELAWDIYTATRSDREGRA